MARRREYPKYDWRGIAMLTEQLGQLFQPNQLQLMDAKQKNEMNLLMAKKSWDMETRNLDTLTRQYDSITKEVASAEEALKAYGLGDLARASSTDGAMGDQASTVFDKLDAKNVRDLQDQATVIRDMKRVQQDKLSNYVSLNEHAKLGYLWPNTFTAKPGEESEALKGRNYKTLHDADKSGTLSWDEQNKAVKNYISDYYSLPEGEKGLNINVGDEVVENVRPEAQAFLAGFQTVRKRGDVDKAEAIVQASKLKTPEQYLHTMYQARETIQDYEEKGMSKRQLSLRKGSPYGKFTSADVDIYTSSHELFKEAYKAYIKKGKKIPEDLIGVAPVTDNMFYNDPDAYLFTEPKEYAEQGLTPEVYEEIQNSTQTGSETYQQIAFNIIYNWEDIMKHGEEQEKQNMLKSLGALKQAYDF